MVWFGECFQSGSSGAKNVVLSCVGRRRWLGRECIGHVGSSTCIYSNFER